MVTRSSHSRLFLIAALATTILGAGAVASPYAQLPLSPQSPLIEQLQARSGAQNPNFDIAFELISPQSRAFAVESERFLRAPRLSAEQRRTREAIVAAYAARANQPFWIADGRWSEAALSAGKRIDLAGEDALALPPAPALQGDEPTAAQELALSESVVAYAFQARGGRVDPQRISRLIGAKRDLPEAAEILQTVSSAGAEADDRLRAYNPPHPAYIALRDKLAELRGGTALHELAPVAEAMAAHAHSDETPRLRRRAATPTTERVEGELIANMERWRWMPRRLGDDRVEVNLPDFSLKVLRGDAPAHVAKVIIGKPETPTPIFSNAVQYVIVNPFWNVPDSIINKEMLPKSGGDLSGLEKRGFKVSHRAGKLVVRQPPGEGNALGRIKFMFPNDYAVYMHDTPSRGLFASAHRAFSHGCMRVEDPFALAEAVLGPGSGWSEARLKRLIGGSERYINLTTPLPIHIEYFTAYVDDGGELRLRGDVYGYSARVRAALGLRG